MISVLGGECNFSVNIFRDDRAVSDDRSFVALGKDHAGRDLVAFLKFDFNVPELFGVDGRDVESGREKMTARGFESL